jgi:hypothetical protein
VPSQVLCIAALPIEHVVGIEYRCRIAKTLNGSNPRGYITPCGSVATGLKLEWVLDLWYIIVITYVSTSQAPLRFFPVPLRFPLLLGPILPGLEHLYCPHCTPTPPYTEASTPTGRLHVSFFAAS